ncbi:GSCOCG00002768001-RA-CDS [Cotesia congregata]|nr:GSCOCG00002768001-RA-CDS [Cotesia congregata]
MGIILSRFRKKKTTIEILEDLDSQIKEIEQYGQTTEQRHKKIVGTLIIYSVLLYVVTAVLFYFYFFPASLYDQLFYITPLLVFPLLIIFTKKLVTWYYKRKISRNQEKLVDMQKEKKKILDQVTETETYKKAKEILLKFAPDQLRMTPLSPQPVSKTPMTTPVPRRLSTPQPQTPMPQPSMATPMHQMSDATELRKRALAATSPQLNSSIGRPLNTGLVPVGLASANTPQQTPYYHPSGRLLNASLIRSPLPRPILPKQRSYLDRLVEYLVGDGPSNRYALICRQCDSHNGMALKEEFEYFGFRCCYCQYWNPARKQKPSAPKLDGDITSPLSITGRQSGKSTDHEATSSSSSGTDSDIEVVDKPDTPEAEAIESDKLIDQKLADKVLNEEKKVIEESEDKSDQMEVDESPRK